MSLVIITIQDVENGDIDFKILSEPPIPVKKPDEATPAHNCAIDMLNTATSNAEKVIPR